MNKKDAFLSEAEGLYIKGKTLKEISELLGVSERTLTRWKKELNWKEKRNKYMKNPLGVEEAIDEEILRLVRELPNTPDSEKAKVIDMISKLAKVKSIFKKEGDLATQAVYVFDYFTNYIKERERSDEIINKLVKHIQGFIAKIMEER